MTEYISDRLCTLCIHCNNDVQGMVREEIFCNLERRFWLSGVATVCTAYNRKSSRRSTRYVT